jgi:hypothetical protein
VGYEVIIIGTGVNGTAEVAGEARIFAKDRKVKLIEAVLSKAIEKFNELTVQGRKVGAIIHATC